MQCEKYSNSDETKDCVESSRVVKEMKEVEEKQRYSIAGSETFISQLIKP